MDETKKIELSALVAGAIHAEEKERYEVLQKIKDAMTPEQAELFFATVEVVKKGLTPPPNENKQNDK